LYTVSDRVIQWNNVVGGSSSRVRHIDFTVDIS